MESNIDIKDIHEVLLRMLVDFDRICRKHNLTYFMLGGTLLGAVRHNGFIPWDDDIDIGMPRSDYERFISLPLTEFPEYLQVWNIRKKAKSYMFNFSKLVNINTSMVPIEHPSFVVGLFLDIFPLDGASKFLFSRKFQVYFVQLFQVLRSYKYLDGNNKVHSIKSLLMMCLSKLLSRHIHGFIDKLVRKYEYSTSKYAGNFLGVYGLKEIMEKDVFGNPVELEFEGHLFYAPQKYDSWLKNIYNNYMLLPPVDKRGTTHEYVSINLNSTCV